MSKQESDILYNQRIVDALTTLTKQRNELLEALKEIVDAVDGDGWNQIGVSFRKARAAITSAEMRNEMIDRVLLDLAARVDGIEHVTPAMV